MKYCYCLSLTFCLQLTVLAQDTTASKHFNVIVRDISGDLNNDNIDDRVTLAMDSSDYRQTMTLQVFLSQHDKQLKPVISSTQASHHIRSLQIEDGLLKIESELGEGYIIFDFKYQKGSFELIKVLKISHDGDFDFAAIKNTIFTVTEINFITGVKYHKQIFGNGSKTIVTKEKIGKTKPLIKLQNFKFSDIDKY
ncbi:MULTISPECIES: hypothetical protein [unclassified Chryseobacterium]|uniref:hypothetical protein n=1 Tax=unclassified Chryseobacterium TaxID=2593645 RepID=UPI000A6B77DD|nr:MULTISPECIES: hypothetical protein [unclassified Chryseobacterium]